MPNLLENKLLLQYLAAAGQDIGQGQPIGSNVNAVTQSNIAAQNYAKLLKQLLEGGGKVNMDKENVSIKAPVGAFGGPSAKNLAGITGQLDTTGGANLTTPTATTAAAEPELQKSQTDLLGVLLGGNVGALNPSSSPLDIAPADLAGLTPTDLSQAMGIKLSRDALVQRQQESAAASDIAMSKELRQWQQLMRQAPLDVPGLGQLSLEDWKNLDTKTKAYSYYAFDAKNRGEEVLPYNEWATQTDEPTAKQIFDIADKDPAFKEFYFASKRAGATKITVGEKVETAEALGGVKTRSYFTSPKGLSTDLTKHMQSDEVLDTKLELSDDPAAADKYVKETKVKFIEDKIESSGGNIVGAEWANEERTKITWKVFWPDTGKTKEYTYGISD
jgi:hypothetical protein